MPDIHPHVLISPTSIDLGDITATAKKLIPVNLNVSFPTEISLSPSEEDSLDANLYLEQSQTVINLQDHDWVWGKPTVTNEGSHALVTPAQNNYTYPLGPDMTRSQTQIAIQITAPSTLGPFRRSLKVSYAGGFQRIEIIGVATGL